MINPFKKYILIPANKDPKHKVEELFIHFQLYIHILLKDPPKKKPNIFHPQPNLLNKIGLYCNNLINFITIFYYLIEKIRSHHTNFKKYLLLLRAICVEVSYFYILILKFVHVLYSGLEIPVVTYSC